MGDILVTIDAAIAELCACGCRRPLDPNGPSAWWATEGCQARWQGGAPTVQLQAAFAPLVDFFRGLAGAFAGIVDAFASLLPPEPPPVRPLARVGAGHTGPKVPPRTPRRIDPRRAR
jgi:hypothetical protein